MVKKIQLWVVVRIVRRGSFGLLLVWLKKGQFCVVISVVKKRLFWVVFRNGEKG